MKSWHGWALLAGFVLAWDYCCEDTLSAGFYRGITGTKKPLVLAAWFVTSAHLFKQLPERADPFYYFCLLRKPSTKLEPRD